MKGATAAILEKPGVIQKINGRAVQASVDVDRHKHTTDLMKSLPKSKLSARQKTDLTVSVTPANNDKSSIMVELQSFAGSISGRNSI